MRKSVVTGEIQGSLKADQTWLDLEMLAQAVLTSEDPGFPIEEALKGEEGRGWRASEPGEQTVALLFDRPVMVKGVVLEFREEKTERTQEFLLRWSADGHSFQEIVRQQYNFNEPNGTREVEEYTLNLSDVKTLELKIVPNISGGSARASLARMRVAGTVM